MPNVYDEFAHISVKFTNDFDEHAVYNIVTSGGVKVGRKNVNFVNTRLIAPHDLNSKGTLFGGRLLEWFDSDASAFSHDCVTNAKGLVTASIFGFNFIKPILLGERLRGRMEFVHKGAATITIKGIYEAERGDKWVRCADGYAVLCNTQNGFAAPLPELKISVNQDTPDWQIVENYKKLTKLKKKE